MKSIPKKKDKNFILVHGGWHGSWCWHKVSRLLRQRGYRVVAPDLPGHGRNPRDFKDIDLSSYVTCIEKLVRASTAPVVLVGHSMSGVVVTQVAENFPDKIERLIYLAAFVPQNRGSLRDEEKQAVTPSVAPIVLINKAQNTISLPLHLPQLIQDLFYASCREEDVEYALSHLQPQPYRPFQDLVSISEERFGRVLKLYIECSQDKAIPIQDQRRMQAYHPCDIATLDTDHSPFFSAAPELVRILTGPRPEIKYN